ncbi:hypothetical protein [Ureibacillus sinduriensis]|uniref:Uncharacterized protein n=2 Tax=Ureibacillus sinduriensis TaxID=561440 RepID=A0A0A3HQU1_9BACL|nr:hypothetical protein [Ureibacillus sinduriensis]KGR74961.1 hypothetical protein CD33_14615 [Ureibacillus sinduriensis BLB-1 = JCM 15800]
MLFDGYSLMGAIGLVDGIYTFYETVKNVNTGEVVIREKMQLKFRTQEEIRDSLQKAGYSIQVYRDWEFKQATGETKSFVFHCTK